jgi:hypothetical protein
MALEGVVENLNNFATFSVLQTEINVSYNFVTALLIYILFVRR